ncbi:unnamed protein product [Linum trigynum]|uniref:Uncharacterized protein n=1 Tax=Linum trigynum TaxID=586398 RepID=A0AAV2C6Q9_9ROSI
MYKLDEIAFSTQFQIPATSYHDDLVVQRNFENIINYYSGEVIKELMKIQDKEDKINGTNNDDDDDNNTEQQPSTSLIFDLKMIKTITQISINYPMLQLCNSYN